MWTSIHKIIKPKTPEEAYAAARHEGSALYGGGTYLMSRKDPSISSLVLLDKIVPDGIEIQSDQIKLGAGVTLQKIVDSFNGTKFSLLADGARWSCPSKNIRNARTIGGEIAEMRINSEISALLYALNPILKIAADGRIDVPLFEWDGDGVIEEIILLPDLLENAALERFSLLPSAPAFIITAGVKTVDRTIIITGGAAKSFHLDTIDLAEWGDDAIESYSRAAVIVFHSDQYGSLEYKQSLIATGVNRMWRQS